MSLGFYKTISSNTVRGWERPLDWLPMEEPKQGDAFIGLHAVFPEGNNFVAFSFTTTGVGQYRVYWPDGTSTAHDSGTVAEKTFDYNSISNSTLCSRGYKQVMILVQPDGQGTLSSCNFQVRRTTTPVQNQNYATGWLDCILAMYSANSGASITFGGITVRHSYCERFDVRSIGNCTSMSNMFRNCYSLQSVPLFETQNVTIMSSMFNNCRTLKTIPLFNTQNVTSMSNMIFTCPSLESVPLFNTQNVTDMSFMFANCQSLKSVPLFNTQSVTNMSSMFSGCFALQTVPLFNTQNVTTMGTMFNSCQSLQSIPALSTNSITTTTGTDFGISFASNCNSLDRCEMSFARPVTLSNCQLSQTAIEEIFNNLTNRGTVGSATINISGNWGVGSTFTKTCTYGNNSTTINMTNTASLEIGMQFTGIGSPLTTAASVSFTDSTDRVTLSSHGLQNGDEVSFASITTTTGIVVNTIYYVRNATTNDFQLSTTPSGSIINLVTNGTGTMRHKSAIVSIVTNSSVTVSRPVRAGVVDGSLTFRNLQTGTALLKNWAVTG
jgi:surface protein